MASSDSTSSEYKEAQRLQNLVALADGYAAGIGIPGLKRLVHNKFGYPMKPRRPLLPISDQQWKTLDHTYMAAVLEEEASL